MRFILECLGTNSWKIKDTKEQETCGFMYASIDAHLVRKMIDAHFVGKIIDYANFGADMEASIKQEIDTSDISNFIE